MDASGRFGSTLVQRLLRRGYKVHAAIQNPSENQGLDCENKNLKIFQSDPFDYHSIIEALKGCSGLFYSFQPPQDQSTYDLWHALSKTLAEKTAWALAMDRGMNLVCINAGLLMGPELSITNPYLKGAAEMYEDGVFVTVDLNSLADAHICVFEDVSSYGRYLCFSHVINSTEDAIKMAQMLDPASPQPQR
ncbi:hypothetical protein CsSME_00035026 [Camellia sinensis var. sinensis]